VREYILTLLTAAAVTYLLTPLVRRVAIAAGAMPAPRERDVHVVRTPLLGGLAMYGGLAAALLLANQLSYLRGVINGTGVNRGLLLAGGLLVVMGVVDDRWGMSALSKLAGQVAAGGILVWSGTELSWIPSPNGNVIVLSPNQALVVTILLVVVTINAVNFIDGLDGLAAGIVGISALAFFAYSYTLVRVAGASTQSLPALVSAILAGMCLGFLPHNFHPARIFMGDTGAMLLGLLLAYGPISSTATLDPSILKNTLNRFPTILPILLPAAIFLIPYADLLLAVARRTRAGQSPFAADKKHLHHRLLNIGHSHRKSVLIMYLWAALFAVTVVSLSVVRTKLLILAGVTLAGMLILLLVSVPRLRPHRRTRPALAGPSGTPVPNPTGTPVLGRVGTLAVNAAGTPAAAPDVPDRPSGAEAATAAPGWSSASDSGWSDSGWSSASDSGWSDSGWSSASDSGRSSASDSGWSDSGWSSASDSGWSDSGWSSASDSGRSSASDPGRPARPDAAHPVGPDDTRPAAPGGRPAGPPRRPGTGSPD
jgi:UDP-GlcNAc:undecaprenyl-phosphate/decaprenyl-phosphate GlcNAc-1-phosphate transferase